MLRGDQRVYGGHRRPARGAVIQFTMEKIRIDRFLSSQLGISRGDAKKLLRGGGVTVNGAPVSKAEQTVDAGADLVAVGGKALSYKKHLYIMMNKPPGVISASRDPKEPTVVDLLPEELKRPGLFPAGRLDKDTTGFVLLTDDGVFAHEILAPRKHVPKNYTARVGRRLTETEEERFRGGMTAGGVSYAPALLAFAGADETDGTFLYSVTIREGKYHQLKLMFAALGAPILRLHRNRIGGVSLDPALAPGQARELTREELLSVRNTADFR